MRVAVFRNPIVGTVSVAALAVGMGLLTRAALLHLLGIGAPYLGFVPWMIAASLMGGMGASILSLAGFVLLGVLSQQPTTLIHTSSPVAGLWLFACGGCLLIAVMEWTSRPRRRLRLESHRADRQLADAQEERERLLVAERCAREEAERASRIKDQFLSVLSHELRTPLTPALMTVSLLENNAELPASLRPEVAFIRRSVELEARLIDDLLDLTRLAQGKICYDFKPVDMHLLIRGAMEICCNDGKHVICSDLGAADSYVRADPARLQQVIWNLLNNAWKFTPPGGQVTISTRSLDRTVTISVKDNGAGIHPELLPRVFDAFEQGDIIRARRFGGLGLGLAICKALVGAHGGKISAASEGEGRGAIFSVELPCLPAPRPEIKPASPEPPIADQERRRLRMLLIEDHPDTLRALTRLLRTMGHEVHGAGSIADGLRAAASDKYDLMISDLGLPDGTGFELMRQLQQSYGLRGIALSGYGMEEDLKRSRDAGFSEHLVKPVDLQKLQEAIVRVAGS